MKWNDYWHQPTSLLFKNTRLVDETHWLRLVNEKGLIRYPNITINDTSPAIHESESPEKIIGEFFYPDRDVSWKILQVAGLLIKRKKMNIDECIFSAKKFGGILYFKWFLYELGESREENPIPGIKFPLSQRRWFKKKPASY